MIALIGEECNRNVELRRDICLSQKSTLKTSVEIFSREAYMERTIKINVASVAPLRVAELWLLTKTLPQPPTSLSSEITLKHESVISRALSISWMPGLLWNFRVFVFKPD